MPDSISTPTEAALQLEATAVERLRRQISDAAQQGQAASPQLLAEFAALQKDYLGRKIEFEKAKRSSAKVVASTQEAEPVELEAAPGPDMGANVPEPATAGRAPALAEQHLEAKPRVSRRMFFLLCAIIGVALGLVLWLLLN